MFRYISKPINRGRFYNALYDAIKEYLSNSKTIVIDMKDEVFKVKTKDILYIEISRRGTVIVTRDGELNTTRKLPEWLSIIDQPDCFIHSHNSIVVNLQNVINFNIKEVKLRKSETEIVTTYMSQRKFPEFKKSFMHYMGG